MITQNPFLKFSLIVLKIAAALISLLLFLSILMLIVSGGDGSILFPGLGLIVTISGVVMLLAMITAALLALIYLLSKFNKSLR